MRLPQCINFLLLVYSTCSSYSLYCIANFILLKVVSHVVFLGKDLGLGVENLKYSGLIAGETSRAYDETVTMNLVRHWFFSSLVFVNTSVLKANRILYFERRSIYASLS